MPGSQRTYQRACIVCGAEFVAKRRDKRRCSQACNNRAWRSKEHQPVIGGVIGDDGIRRCGRCGVSIEHRRSDARWCGKDCASLAWYYDVARDLKQKAGRICAGCDGSIPSDRHANARFCSLPCRGVAQRLKVYGLTPAQYRQLLVDQGHACAICRKAELRWKTDLRRDGWHVDHDHATGRVRGVLCPPCNLLLGYAKDDPVVLARALAYLGGAELVRNALALLGEPHVIETTTGGARPSP